MSERKVLNKYYPPNFDPSIIPKVKKVKDRQHKVRLMAPFSMRCESCGEYIYKGKKFNARKETVKGETYYSILIFRFFIRCPRCAAEITFKTDPKNADYVAEHGVSRNFEPWRDEDQINRELLELKEKEEENNPLKALENRTKESKREMEIMEGLDEIRTRNARFERMDASELLDKLIETNDSDEDEKIANEVFKAKREREEGEEMDPKEKEAKVAQNHIQELLKKSGIQQNWVQSAKNKEAHKEQPKVAPVVKKSNNAPSNGMSKFGIIKKKEEPKVETSKPILSLVNDYSDSDEEQ